MKNVKRALSLALALVLLCTLFAGCQQQEQSGDNTAVTGQQTGYTVTVKSAGGMALENVSVAIYTDATLADLQNHAVTNESGVATLQLPEHDGYVAVLSGVPRGYALEASYPLTGTATQIQLTSSVITDEKLGDTMLGLGDVMRDFTVISSAGQEITLSEVLKQKDMVLLNFWYTTCSWCVTEFPYLESAYQLYKDDIEVIALDPLDGAAAVEAFPASQNLDLNFPMAACPASFANAFGITGYPVSVAIDRYGVIVLIESGAITSLRPFTCLFDTLTGEDYQQKLYQSVGEVVTVPKPTFQMAPSEEIAAILGTQELEITFHPETDDSAENSWPFIEAEKNGEVCLKASNQQIDDSFAILYADVTLKAGQALGFDFLRSTEALGDFLYVIVDGEDINSISGWNTQEVWETTYPLVAFQDGTYELALCYLKDGDTCEGDDTVYIKNMRVVDASQIDAPSYIPCQVASTEDGFTYTYEDIYYNEADGYYHVESKNGPLLLADLMGYTQFNEESSIWMMAYEGDFVLDGVNYVKILEEYSNYSINSNLYGVCTVNQELYEVLQVVDTVAGFDEEDDREWLKICKYFKAYGTDGVQLEDPIAGLAPHSAYTAKLGKNVPTNYFYYNRAIMPRGLFAEFIPARSGAYRFTSHNESAQGVDAWVFNADKEILLTYEHNERRDIEEGEVSVVYYMEAGTPYYINIAFWDLYETGYIYYDVEYLGAKYNHFVACSMGYFTYDTNATGDAMYHTIAGGIDVVLGSDGIYYHDLGDGKKGSKIYADFTGGTAIMEGTPILSSGDVTGLLDAGAFDFSKSDDDTFILNLIKKHGDDTAKIEETLKNYWIDEYEANYWIYEDVKNGVYHGAGKDYTEVIRSYANKMIRDGSIKNGCVVVTEELAGILQMLIDKYSFAGVDNAWIKLCYYDQYMG